MTTDLNHLVFFLSGNMISSCHFEKSTLNKAGNHVILLTEFRVGIRTKHVRKYIIFQLIPT